MDELDRVIAALSDDMPTTNTENFVADSDLLWEGRPSQWINFGRAIIAVLTLPIPLINILTMGMLIYKIIQVYCRKYTVYSNRIELSYGILFRHHDNVNMYRVKDVHIYAPLLWRIAGMAGVIMVTSDKTNAVFPIECVRDAKKIMQLVIDASETQRDTKGVREIDIR